MVYLSEEFDFIRRKKRTMVKVLRKVIEKSVNCPKCGRKLSFDDSDEKYFSEHKFNSCDKSKFICCPCGYCIQTRIINGDISSNVTLMTADATEEANNE